MKTKLVTGIILQSVILSAFLGLLPQRAASSAQLQQEITIDPHSWEHVLSATVQISIFPHGGGEEASTGELRRNGNAQNPIIETVYERGLGTLVELSGEVMIITHNHWEFIDEVSKAQFRNAKGELLMEIDGATFQELIRYHDGGTLLLVAPAKISPSYLQSLAARSLIKAEQVTKTTSLAELESLRAGAQVLVPHQSQEDPDRISVTAAVVESVTTVDGLPSLKLRSLDGELIIKGDSGGGIWLDGQLAGNMWKSEVVSGVRSWLNSLFSPTTAHAYTSYAAILPADVRELGMIVAFSDTGDRDSGLVE